MSPRNQLAKLRKDLRIARTNDQVQAISRLMDDLSAIAAGGEPARNGMSLAEYFEFPQPAPIQQRNMS